MKKITLLSIITLLAIFMVKAQTDTLYIMKGGEVVKKYNVTTELDSIIFYNPVSEVEEPWEPSGTFTDKRDGNTYKYVTIGQQMWMAQDMRYLPSVSSPNDFSPESPRYYVYGYTGTDVAEAKNTANYPVYGVLYNWIAAMDGAASSQLNPSGVRGVCPAGWHIPSDAEIQQMVTFVGATPGLKLREAGTEHWLDHPQQQNATNMYGFTFLPTGQYNSLIKDFEFLQMYGYIWSSTEDLLDPTKAGRRFMLYNTPGVPANVPEIKQNGYAVRCVKD